MTTLYGQCAKCGGNLTVNHRCPDYAAEISPTQRRLIRRLVKKAIKAAKVNREK